MPKKPKDETLNAALDFLATQVESCYVDLSNSSEKPPSIHSGSMTVDMQSGIGGFPQGGITEIAGEWSSGKTTLSICCATEVQRNGGIVLFVDFEQAFDPYYAVSLGLDLTSPVDGGKFILLQPETLEEGWDTLIKLTRTGDIALVIVDSIAAGMPRAKVEGLAGEGKIAEQSALLAPEYNKLASACKRKGTTALLLNQIRVKMEKQGRNTIVSKDTSGGNALKHYCLMRLWMKIIEKIEDKDDVAGYGKNFVANRVRFQFIKNKCGKPYLTGQLVIRYGVGIDNECALMDMAIELEVLDQRGAYFIFVSDETGEVKIKGREPTRERIKTDDKFRNALMVAVKEAQ